MPPAGFFSRKAAIGEPSPSGSQQLDLGVADIDEDHRHAVLRQRLRRAHRGAQRVAISGAGRGKVGNGQRDVVQSSEHLQHRSSA